jgi:hypothetical protein
MPKEILIKPTAGQILTVNPEGDVSIQRVQTAKNRLQTVITMSGVYVEPTPPPASDYVEGWGTPAFVDDFAVWDPAKWNLYPSTDVDTSGRGQRNAPPGAGAISSDGSKLRVRIGTYNGRPCGFHAIPLIPGGFDRNALRLAFRTRSDPLAGYKTADMNGWPEWNTYGSGNVGGENDIYEGNLDANAGPPKVFQHDHADRSKQLQWSYPAGWRMGDWHTVESEWVGGRSFRVWGDGILIAESLDVTKIAKGPMHPVLQYETNLDGAPIDPSTAGFVEFEFVKVWVK